MTDSDHARRALVIRDGLRAVEEWEAENGALTDAELSTARRRVTADTDRMTDHAWADRLGPAFAGAAVARLLGRPAAGVAGDPGLLRLTARDGQAIYPLLQFVPRARRTLPHLAEILRILDGPLLPLTIASWLVTPQSDLDGRTPRQALLDGDGTRVLELAQRLAATSG